MTVPTLTRSGISTNIESGGIHNLKTYKTQDNKYGLLASQVKTIYPELVDEFDNIDYGCLVVLLLHQIQELKQNLV